jgi:tRNA(Ile)-lysidine synthetase-like protein
MLAFSGGPDSTGLAALLRDRQPLLAYVDHRMRGRDAQRAERWEVCRIARDLGLPLVRTRVRVDGPGGEGDARQARYSALEALCNKHRCTALVLAHSADDRAETVLFHLLRGTGTRGLAAMRRETRIRGVTRLRPALDRRRSDLRLAAAPYRPIRDRTNRSTATARARLRHLVLPGLEKTLGEDPVPLLCALANHADALREELETRAAGRAPEATRPLLLAEPVVAFPYLVEAMRGEGPPLTRAAYASLRAYLAAGRGDRAHTTPGGDCWRVRPAGAIEVTAGGVEIKTRTSSPTSTRTRPSER